MWYVPRNEAGEGAEANAKVEDPETAPQQADAPDEGGACAKSRPQLGQEFDRPEMKGNSVVADYAVTAGFDHAKLKLSKLKGLLLVQIVVNASGATLRTYWSDKRAFDANEDLFLEQAFRANRDLFLERPALAPQAPTWLGVHRVTREPLSVRAVYRKYSARLWAGVALAILVVGYIDDMRGFLTWAVLPPDAALSARHAEPVNILVGERFNVEFEIVNNRNYGDCDVTLEDFSFSPDDGELTFEPMASPKFSAIGPGKRQSFTVNGTAHKAGEFEVIVSGEAGAGWFFTDDVTAPSTIKVWKPIQIGNGTVDPGRHSAKLCRAQFELTLGRKFDNETHLTAYLKDPGDLRFTEKLLFPGNPVPIQGANAEEASISWKTNTLTTTLTTPFKPIVFWLFLEGDNSRDLSDWKNVVGRIGFDFPGLPK